MDDLKPARKIPLSSRANTGYIPSSKVSEGVASYESRVERDYYLLCNHDPSILQFQPQPQTIRWVGPDQKVHEYTPDVLVITAQGGTFLVEIKEEVEIEANSETYRARWLAADASARQNGWEFRVITEKMIRTPRLKNVWFCLGASRANLPEIQGDLNKLVGIVKASEDSIEYRTLCIELARFLGMRVDQAARLSCYAIYFGLVWVDTFSTLPLSATTLIRPSSPQMPSFRPLFNEINGLTVQDIYSDGNSHDGNGSLATVEERRFPQVPSKYERTVGERERVVKEWLSVPSNRRTAEWRHAFEQRAGHSRRAVERWVQRYQQGGIEGLIPQHSKAGRPVTMPGQVQELMEEFRQKYLRERLSTIKGIYGEFAAACEERNLRCPSEKTFQRHVNQTPASELAKAKKGNNLWRQEFRPALDTFKDAVMPLQVVEIDNTAFDVFPVDEEGRESLGPPNLVAALDVYSQMVTGYYLTFDHPSRVTALEVATMTILPKDKKVEWRQAANPWPIDGLPVLILVDNGMDYRAGDVKKFCLHYGIILEYAPLRTPEFKAYIEQWFEVLKKGVQGENLPGFRPSLQQRRNMPEVDFERQASLTLQELEWWLVSWIVDTYHERAKQKGHLPSPLTLASDAQAGRTALPLPAPVALSAKEQGAAAYNALHRLAAHLSNRGITKAYLQYNSTELQALYQGKGKIAVDYRFDPRDIREIYVIHPDSGKVIAARPAAGWARALLETYGDAPLSEVEWKRILKFAREKNRGRVSLVTIKKAEMERRREVAAATQETGKARKKSKRARRGAELKKEHAKKSLPARLHAQSAVEKQEERLETGQDEGEDDYVPKKKSAARYAPRGEEEEEDDYQPKKSTYQLYSNGGQS